MCVCVCSRAHMCVGGGVASGRSVQLTASLPPPQHGGGRVRGGLPPGGRDPSAAHQQRLHDLCGPGGR